jgi:hypothetical protein
MNNGILKRFAAGAVVFSIWSTGLIVLPTSALAQDTPKDKPVAAKDDKKASDDKKDSGKKAAVPAPTPGKLSTKEDPAQIGKRNINGGTGDKFFGWLGGSKDKEMAIGRQLAAEVEAQSKMVTDPVITEYVNRVGQNIVLHSDAKMPFTIKVIDSDEVNAFALPGGYFFVHRGLIMAAENESELAGVMAHEIAHVAARHAMENQGKGAFINYAALAGMIFGGPIVSTVLQNGGGILAGLAQLKFSRGAEEEADKLGVQYMYAAGYDPTGMATMFEKLLAQNKKKPGTVARLFSTHPQLDNRREASQALAARFPEKEEYMISTSDFQRVKAHLLQQTNARAGIVSDFDNPEEGRPTLKKRTGDTTDGDPTLSGGTGDSSSSDSGPPKLKKKDDPPPQPTPTPSM